MWHCYGCGATGNPSGFKATTDELERHFATSMHPVKNAMGVIDPIRPQERCQHGFYTYGGQAGNRTRIEVGPHLFPAGQEIAESSSWERLKEGIKEATGGFYLGRDPPGPFGSSAGRSKAVSQSDMCKDKFFTVIDVYQETPDTVSILTDFPPEWEPGQFSMLGVPGTGEVPISFSGVAGDEGGTPAYTQQTVRAVGRVTGEICKLRPGARVSQRGPFGHGWEYDTGPRYACGDDLLIVAGGCGICPLRHIIDIHNAPMTIVYGARSAEDFYFRDEEWFQDQDDTFLITNAEGFVTDRIQPWMVGEHTVALVCGPEPMMKATAEKLVDLGMKPEHIQVSLERRMVCSLGMCGVCSCGKGNLTCVDGPVFSLPDVTWR